VPFEEKADSSGFWFVSVAVANNWAKERKNADSCLQIMICELIRLQLKLAGALNDTDLERMRARYEIQRNSLSLKLISNFS
jgi:hypothetical protein